MNPEGNPYSADPIGDDHIKACERTCSTLDPFLHQGLYPDMGSALVHCIEEPRSEAAEICRAIEGAVFDRDWGMPPDDALADFSQFEDNSTFFLLTDSVDGRRKPIGTLRVADLLRGPSESEAAYRELIGDDAPLPVELQRQPLDHGLWDVVGVAVLPEHRNGIESAWLYYALYRASLDRRISRWISNVTPRELRNLRDWMGIPFREVGDRGRYLSPVDGTETEFIFCECHVSEIEDAMTRRIGSLERDGSELSSAIAQAARAALSGRFAPDSHGTANSHSTAAHP